MAYLSQTLNLDTIGAITNSKISEKIADNATQKIALWYFLNRMGHKEFENGGYDYRLPVMKEFANTQAYTGNTVLDSAEADPVTAAVFQRKQFSTPIVLTGTKLMQNNGAEAVVSYLETMLENAAESLKDTLAGSTLGIMSAQGDSDLGITGLQTMLPDVATTGTYGLLSRATYSFWRHNVDTVATGFNTDGISGMRRVLLAAARGDEVSTCIAMTVTGYTNLLRALTGQISFDQAAKNTPLLANADIGFQAVNFHGAAVFPDSYVPANRAYFLNLKYLKLMVQQDRDFAVREPIAAQNQDSMVARMFWAGNLVCNNLARQGQLGGLIETWA